MKKNNLRLIDDQISLIALIILLWREKILILSTTIIFSFLFYLSVAFEPQVFKTEITVKNPPSEIFVSFSNKKTFDSLSNKITKDLNTYEEFIVNFKLNILSLDNLQKFVDENKENPEINNFNKYLVSQNITAKQYFEGRIGEVTNKNKIIPNKYFLFFTNDLNGDTFLNNYINFVKKITINETKHNLKLKIENQISQFEQTYNGAKFLDLKTPTASELSRLMNNITSEYELGFYLGYELLSYKISNLKKKLVELKDNEFNYSVILEKASKPKITSKSKINVMLFGSIFGLFFSLLLIFLGLRMQNIKLN